MTTASNGVALVATQLAHTDRRALSQAWYSALHVAVPDAPLARSRPRGDVPLATRRSTRAAAHVANPAPAPAASKRGSLAARPFAVSAGIERRRFACDVVRRVDRAVTSLATSPKRRAGACTVDVAGGRIRLLVRRDGDVTRIVALCAGPLRERVERALAHARFSLAARGTVVAS